jgi:hypothetical protein
MRSAFTAKKAPRLLGDLLYDITLGVQRDCWAAPRFDQMVGCCSVCRRKMRHLVCVCLHERRACRGARNIVTTGRICRQPVEPITSGRLYANDKAEHICHEHVGDGKGSDQPFASYQQPLHVLEAGAQELDQMLPPRHII